MSLAVTAHPSSPKPFAPRFGQINLERFQDAEGAQHSYIEINLSKNRYDYYFTHQLNSIQSGPIAEVTTLTERYQPQDLSQPTVFSAFKRDLLRIVNKAKQSFPQTLDEYSQDELSSLNALLTRPDSYIRKSEQGDYFLSISHSNNALRNLEGLPPQGLPPYVQWPPPDTNPAMGIQTVTKPSPVAKTPDSPPDKSDATEPVDTGNNPPVAPVNGNETEPSQAPVDATNKPDALPSEPPPSETPKEPQGSKFARSHS